MFYKDFIYLNIKDDAALYSFYINRRFETKPRFRF